VIGSKKAALINPAVLGLLLAISFLYFREVLNYWFFYDDPSVIVSSLGSFSDIFLSNKHSYAFYTPFLQLSFKPDVLIFGMNPFPYHVHNVVVLVLVAFMTYLLLIRLTDRTASLIAALMVLLSAPSLVCVTWITLRQYLYATLFSLMAIYLYLKYKPGPRKSSLVFLITLVLCELSFMGKEQFLALPFLFFVLAGGGLKQRIYRTYPYFILMAVHFSLRWYVLGDPKGGYLGLHYRPEIYVKTIFQSLQVTSAVLFGYSWVWAFLAAPLLLSPRKIFLSVLVWLSALSISFLQMYFHPAADSYRYWFISAVLFSFLAGLGASQLRKRLLRIVYLSVVVVLFLAHSLRLNEELKNLFAQETAIAQSVSEALIDEDYRDALFLFPEDRYLAESSYIYNISQAFSRVSGAETYAVFIPIGLLSFYPEIREDYTHIYEFKGTDIVGISDVIGDRLDGIRMMNTGARPETGLVEKGHSVILKVRCDQASWITVYTIRPSDGKFHVSQAVLPYMQRIDLSPFIRNRHVELLPPEMISFRDRNWIRGERPLGEEEYFMIGFCKKADGMNTLLSSAVYIGGSEPAR
jgi:hypothetical protein